MSFRAAVMLGLLAVIALALTLIVSLLVPPGWADLLPLPRLVAEQVEGRPPDFVDQTPTPQATITATVTPAPGGRVEPPRDAGRRGLAFLPFGPFGPSHAGLSGFAELVATLLLLLAAGVLLVYIVPRRMGNIAAAMRGRAPNLARLGLIGLAAYIMISVLGVLIIVSALGPFAWLLIVPLVYFATLVALVAISLPFGRWLGRRLGLAEQPPLVDLLAGLLLIFIIGLVPFVGVLALAALALVGLGATVQTRAGADRGWDLNLDELQY